MQRDRKPGHNLARFTMAFVLAGGRGSRLMELTDKRAKPAVYFGGKSRIIDFALSNAMNSGIRRISVATQYKAHSLIRHMQRGWNFFRPERNESFDILPASQRVSETQWYAGTADAVFQNIDIIQSYGPSHLVILAGDHIYKMDYELMLQDHANAGADEKSVLTIHNLAFQGQFSASIFADLKLPPEAFSINGVEYYGGVGYLKGGLHFADAITTVSPTYAEEITTPGNGMGLDGLLRTRRGVLSGIVNGVDVDVWNPATDTHLIANYGPGRLRRRAENKREIERRFALAPGDGAIFAVVSRLTWQKGLDLLAAAIDLLVANGARLAVLGSGDAAIEDPFRVAAAVHRGHVGLVTGYNEPLSHLLQGGADAILIPSRFEPCGLTQFYGLRYGCVPVVARVGGLADTIIDANDAALSAGVATGVQFFPVDAGGLERGLKHALDLYAQPDTWESLQKRGMRHDVSWDKSAGRYAAIYKSLAGGGSA